MTMLSHPTPEYAPFLSQSLKTETLCLNLNKQERPELPRPNWTKELLLTAQMHTIITKHGDQSLYNHVLLKNLNNGHGDIAMGNGPFRYCLNCTPFGNTLGKDVARICCDNGKDAVRCPFQSSVFLYILIMK